MKGLLVGNKCNFFFPVEFRVEPGMQPENEVRKDSLSGIKIAIFVFQMDQWPP